MGKIIGIDLGTTNSAFAYMLADKPEVIANAEGNRTTPSVVAINKKGERLVGQVAQRQRVTNPKNTIYGVKRLIGRKFNDKEVQKDLDIMPYQIVKKGTGVAVKMGDKEYTPEEVSAMILSKIKRLLPWRTAWKKAKMMKPSWFSTSVAVPSTFLFWSSATACLR